MIFSLFRNTYQGSLNGGQKKAPCEKKKNCFCERVFDRTPRPDKQIIFSSPLPPSIVYCFTFFFFLSTSSYKLFFILYINIINIKFYNFIYRTHAYQSTPLLISCRSSFTTLCRQITCFNRRHRTTCPTGMTLHKK